MTRYPRRGGGGQKTPSTQFPERLKTNARKEKARKKKKKATKKARKKKKKKPRRPSSKADKVEP